MNLAELAAVLFTAAVVGGGLGALLGLGGGFVIVPILTLVFHLDIRLAVGTSIVAVVATSSAGAARNMTGSLTNLRVAVFLAMATTVGAVTGAWLAGVVHTSFLFALFGIVLFASALQMLLKLRRTDPSAGVAPEAAPASVVAGPPPVGEPATTATAASATVGHGASAPVRPAPDGEPPAERQLADRLVLHSAYFDEAEGEQIPYQVRNGGLGLFLMYIAGAISGLLGIGSGALKVPAMDLAMHLPMKVSTSTSNFLIGLTASASSVVYFARGDIDPAIAGPIALGMLLGAALGARLLRTMRAEWVRALFVVVLMIVGLQMLWKGIA